MLVSGSSHTLSHTQDYCADSVLALIKETITSRLLTNEAKSWALPVDTRRLFHGRGHCYPGAESLCIDSYQPVVLITLFAELPIELEQPLVTELAALKGCECVVIQRRYQAGAPSDIAWGTLPENTVARRGPLAFEVSFAQRQNSGFFLDMEPGRQWLERRVQNARVLNLFAYTCAFSVVAVAAGAACVVNVDMSKNALSQGRRNHQVNRLDKRCSQFLGVNIMKSWSRIKKPGPYNVIIIDPPSYQPGSFVAQKDYAKLIRRIPEFAQDGAEILACLNSPELDESFLQAAFAEHCPAGEFVERLAASDDFPDNDSQRQLKLCVFRYRAEA